ncbi:hypothetical protein FRC08_015555 [Ceratobasidium sp. 394]|nr:hypothetical protein FRC08_015555 [Ceratobasidium sp. 394]
MEAERATRKDIVQAEIDARTQHDQYKNNQHLELEHVRQVGETQREKMCQEHQLALSEQNNQFMQTMLQLVLGNQGATSTLKFGLDGGNGNHDLD